MTTVEFLIDGNNTLLGFHVHGHSGYAEQGEDIVCAAVSSAVIMTINTVTEIMHIKAKESGENGEASLIVPEKDAGACQSILRGLRLHLLELEKQYGEFITIKFTEV